jgi:hypothetical protein
VESDVADRATEHCRYWRDPVGVQVRSFIFHLPYEI